ncbi:MAG: M48 family metallopeptidase [Vampirovibrionales bacterium]
MLYQLFEALKKPLKPPDSQRTQAKILVQSFEVTLGNITPQRRATSSPSDIETLTLLVHYHGTKNRQTVEMRWHSESHDASLSLAQWQGLSTLTQTSMRVSSGMVAPQTKMPSSILHLKVSCRETWLKPSRHAQLIQITQELAPRFFKQTYRRKLKDSRCLTPYHSFQPDPSIPHLIFDSVHQLEAWVQGINHQTLAHPHYRGLRLGHAKKTRIAQMNVTTGIMTLSRYALPQTGIPEPLLHYLVIHELCHLVHPNHSPAFWHLVQRYCPNYKQASQALKAFFAHIQHQHLPLMFETPASRHPY